MDNQDYIGKEKIWEQNYEINRIGAGNDIVRGHRCYTDGSKTKYGVGSGVCIMENSWVTKTRAFGLSSHSSVFQAELQAIRMACPLIKENVKQGSHITIMSDSQAAIKALQNVDTTSGLVKATKEALNSLGENYKVSIQWIKAHNENKGNEIADRIAKTGSKLEPNTEIGCGKAYVKQLITEEMYKTWNQRWQTGGNCRQTFAFCNHVDRGKSKKVMKLSRFDLGILVRYTTGHVHLRRHNKIAGTGSEMALTRPEPRYELNDPDDTFTTDDEEVRCRLCKLRGKEETPIHIFKECLAVWRQRRENFGEYTFENDDLLRWEPASLVGFFKEIDLENRQN